MWSGCGWTVAAAAPSGSGRGATHLCVQVLHPLGQVQEKVHVDGQLAAARQAPDDLRVHHITPTTCEQLQ